MKSSEVESPLPNAVLQVGEFRVNRGMCTVFSSNGEPVVLEPRLFDALIIFIDRRGRLIRRAELIDALWPDLVVEEINLSQTVSLLRRSLNDQTEPYRYIQTIPRRGYRFIADVRVIESCDADGSPALVAPSDGAAIRVHPAEAARTMIDVPPVASSPRASHAARTPWPARIAGAALALAAAASLAFVIPGWRAPVSVAQAPVEIAVLPFKPLVAEGRDERLELGIADSLIARLSAAGGLAVRSLASVRAYGNEDADPRRVARELGVSWIVDGTVQRWGNRVRVTVRLLRADDGTAIWSGTFDEAEANAFDLHDVISQRIAATLSPRLASSERDRGPNRTPDPEVERLLAAARAEIASPQGTVLRRSLDLYQRAIERDSRNARAHAGMARAYTMLPLNADTPPIEAFEPARKAVERALEIDPRLPAALAAQGWVRFFYDWDWNGAETSFRRALEIDPNLPEAHMGLGHMLSALGRADEGFPHVQRARVLDPDTVLNNTIEGGYLLARGRRDEGAAHIEHARAMHPDSWIVQLTLAGLALVDKAPDQALQHLRRAEQLSGGVSLTTSRIGRLHARAGRVDEARAVLDVLTQRSTDRYVPPTALAGLQLAVGDKQAALDSFERAYAARDVHLAFLKSDGRWTELRSEPRFRAIATKMGLDVVGPQSRPAH